MSNVFTPLLPTAIDVFWQTLASKSAAWNMIARIRNDAVPSLKLSELRTGGSAGFGSWDGGAISATDFDSKGSTAVSPAAFKKQMVITKYDAEDNPMVVQDTASRLADEAAYKLGALVWAAFAATASTDHPTIAGKKIADAHTFGTNKGTSALSKSSLNAARAFMRKYQNHDGDVIPFEGFQLIVPPALEDVGKQLVRSPSLPNSPTNGGESDLVNTLLGVDSGITGVYVAPLLSDATDWALVCGASDARKPFDLWLRSPIEFIPTIDPSTQALMFNVMFRANVLAKPDCDTGIFYSAVAG